MDGIVALAQMFKKNENIERLGIQTGKVIESLPDIKISLDNKILLTKEHLIFSQHILQNHERKYETIDINKNNNWSTERIIKFTNDAIKKGDYVILIPTEDEQLYYVIDKAVKL